METKRRKFQGVLNILSFNRHFYIIGLCALALLIVVKTLLDWPQVLFWVLVVAIAYGLVMPLIVSAYVYDFSGYYHFDWLRPLHLRDTESQQLVNIHAGFDETSYIINKKFPKSDLKVFDFYDSARHTEAAIVRARKVSNTFPGTQKMVAHQLPLEDNTVDVLFLLSAVHEIRHQDEKIEFLKDCRRVCKPNAHVVMVEHLRDLPNFMAFSVGFTHFFSRNTWRNAFKHAGFAHIEETKFTPFMSIFNIHP